MLSAYQPCYTIQWNPGITVTLGTDKNGRNLGMAVFVK